MDVSYPEFRVSLTLLSTTRLKFEIKEGPLARTEVVDIHVLPLGNSLFAVSWQEKDGATVANIQDYDRHLVHSFATLPDGTLLRMTGTVAITRTSDVVFDDQPRRNKALVLEAMTALFQRRDASAVERLYARDYVQHNPDIPQGRDALQALVADLSDAVHYEPGLAIAEGDFVAIHGRIRGWSEKPQVVIDLFRIEGGKLAEHWDVLQEEVPASAARTGIAMFDPGEGVRFHQPRNVADEQRTETRHG
ncbi:nuclear transport factor 2 family protein [Luteimonas saliphila]|uniref:nuclear transport factor 2 family protein n=1 Tax=Luteimonas saliphila TaxID=2804919 RepID=UPI00192DDFEA|nr:nuclear transport factor 2 family protein [Luteimonas saliphila]